MSQASLSKPTCSICGKTIEGQAYDDYQNYTNFQFSGFQCQHCGGYICSSREHHKITSLKRIFFKPDCMLCGNPVSVSKRFYVYTGKGKAETAVRLLEDSMMKDIYEEELLSLLSDHGPQVIELIFLKLEKKDIFGREGAFSAELQKIANIAKVGAVHVFKDGKVEKRLIELAHHERDYIRHHARLALIQIEGIIRTGRAIPMLGSALEDIIDDWYRVAFIENLVSLSIYESIIDGLLNSLENDSSFNVRQMLASNIRSAIGKDKTINDKIIVGLINVLGDDYSPPREEISLTALFVGQPSVAEVAAHSLKEITGQDFKLDMDKWKAWWNSKQ